MESQTIIGKALSNPLRLQILEELTQGPLTLDDLSARIALKAESILHHIRILQQVGLVEEFEPVRTGAPGRPYSRFKLTGKTVTIQYPTRNYHLLSDVLFQHLSDIFDVEELKQMLKNIGRSVGKDISQTLSSKYEVDNWTLKKLKQCFVDDYLKSYGLQPEVITSDEERLQYRQYNCLFLELAKKYPDLVCTMDEGVMEGLFSELIKGSEVKRLRCLALDGNYCEYLIRLKQ